MSSRFGMLRPIQNTIIKATPPPNQGPRASCSMRDMPAQAANPSGPRRGMSTTRPKSRLKPVIERTTNRVAVYQCRPRSQGCQRSRRRPLLPPSSGTLPREREEHENREQHDQENAAAPIREQTVSQLTPVLSPLLMRICVSMFFQSLDPAESGIDFPVTEE